MERFLTITSNDGNEAKASEVKKKFEGAVNDTKEKVSITNEDETVSEKELYPCKDCGTEANSLGDIWVEDLKASDASKMYYYDDVEAEAKYRSFEYGQKNGRIAGNLKITNEEVNTVSTLTIDGIVAPEYYEESEFASIHIKGEVTDKVVTLTTEEGKFDMYFVSVEDSYRKGAKGEQYDYPLFVAVMKQNTTSPSEIYIMLPKSEYYGPLADMASEVKITWKITNVAPSKSAQQVETAQAMFSNLLNKVSEATTVAEARGAARTAEIFNHKYLQDALANIF